jgi:predicted AAA+ superfamily ATPase
MIARKLNPIKNWSFFLFGARGTGKTTLLERCFDPSEVVNINLLEPKVFASLQADPSLLTPMIAKGVAAKQLIIIDEIQKVPALLDIVHLTIERDKARFALTGSSARKLHRGAANMLAGRAYVLKLYPFLAEELAGAFNLQDALEWGLLPTIWNTSDSVERSLYLQSYAETYLKEEIVVEQIIRNLPPFRRFLNVASQMSGKIVNYSKIAADCQTDPSNVRNYYQILEETLIGFFLEPFHRSIRKRQSQSPKFYFIDSGIARALAGHLDLPLRPQTSLCGDVFEAFIINQIRTHLEYSLKQYQLSFLRTKDGAEIDLIVERSGKPTFLIEIKSSPTVREEELRNLKALSNDMPGSTAICLHTGASTLSFGHIECLPWQDGIRRIIDGN